MRRVFPIAAGLLAATLSPSFAADKPASTLTFSTGLDYSSGDYGTANDTKILYAPFTARLVAGDFSFSATVPFLQIEGTGDVVGGGDGGPIVTQCGPLRQRLGQCRPTSAPPTPVAPGVTRTSGLGDISLSANYLLPEDVSEDWLIEFQSRVKLPTASASKGLGTGKADFSFGVDVSRPVGALLPFVTLGYRLLGNPDFFALKNGLTASVGTGIEVGTSALLISYDYSAASVANGQDSHSLFGSWSVPINDKFRLTTYGVAGLSAGSPDFALGLQIAFKLGLRR
jgi:hypothetical protein